MDVHLNKKVYIVHIFSRLYVYSLSILILHKILFIFGSSCGYCSRLFLGSTVLHWVVRPNSQTEEIVFFGLQAKPTTWMHKGLIGLTPEQHGPKNWATNIQNIWSPSICTKFFATQVNWMICFKIKEMGRYIYCEIKWLIR